MDTLQKVRFSVPHAFGITAADVAEISDFLELAANKARTPREMVDAIRERYKDAQLRDCAAFLLGLGAATAALADSQQKPGA